MTETGAEKRGPGLESRVGRGWRRRPPRRSIAARASRRSAPASALRHLPRHRRTLMAWACAYVAVHDQLRLHDREVLRVPELPMRRPLRSSIQFPVRENSTCSYSADCRLCSPSVSSSAWWSSRRSGDGADAGAWRVIPRARGAGVGAIDGAWCSALSWAPILADHVLGSARPASRCAAAAAWSRRPMRSWHRLPAASTCRRVTRSPRSGKFSPVASRRGSEDAHRKPPDPAAAKGVGIGPGHGAAVRGRSGVEAVAASRAASPPAGDGAAPPRPQR